MSSFTDLERIHKYNILKQENPEKGTAVVETVEYVETSCSLCDSWKGYESGFTPADFPRGKRVGDLLHRFFERNYFHLPLNEERICQLYQQLKLSEEWQAPLTQWLTHILQTPLVDDFCLKNLKPEDCVKEMKFFFNLHRTFDVDAFNQVWQKYYPSARPWLFEQMQGMLQGYVDLVFRHQGKYYILDYKSNFLGEHLEDYHSSKLASVMVAEHYDLQAVIYTLAVNRYLKQRLPNYDYKQHFGGVIYTFLRGMNGESAEYGIFADCLSLAFIDELEGLF